MPLWFLPALLGLCAAVSLAAGLWLLLHLRDVASVFSGRREGELVPGPGRKRASDKAVWIAILVFNAGWIACLVLWLLTAGGEANVVVDATT